MMWRGIQAAHTEYRLVVLVHGRREKSTDRAIKRWNGRSLAEGIVIWIC